MTQSSDFSVPFATEPLLQGSGSDLRRPAFLWVRLMGRVRPGTTIEQAAAGLNEPLQRAMLDDWQQAMAGRRPGATGDSVRILADASLLRGETAVATALASRSVLEPVLFGLTPVDPMSIGGALTVLLAVTLLAAAIPARRAASIDPLMALKVE